VPESVCPYELYEYIRSSIDVLHRTIIIVNFSSSKNNFNVVEKYIILLYLSHEKRISVNN